MSSIAADVRALLIARLNDSSPAEVLRIACGIAANEQIEAANHAGAHAKPIGVAAAQRFTKISAEGERLSDSATEWDGVLDSSTGLVWGRKLLPGSHSWKEALEAASKATLCGKAARAPTIQERQSIIDYARHSPALHADYFAKESGWEWTSTPDAQSPSGYAWCVHLDGGSCGRYGQGGRSYVRAVLAGQQLNLL